MSDLEAQLKITADASGVEAGVEKGKRSLKDLGKTAEQVGQQASDGLGKVGQGGDNSAKKVDAATKSMIQSIQRTTAVMEAGSKSSAKYYELLAAQRGVPVDALKPYLVQLDQVAAKQKLAEQTLNATSPAMNQLGISAKQTAAALRGVPAQFTDIVTALQGGQAPLTVFLQQGGQLKDMFGGIGPAAKALGGYIAGLINPFTIAAGAAVALGVAYNQGSKEADAYNKALIMTGNAAGKSAGQLADMAASVSKSVGTQGAAAAALAQLAGTGRVAGDNLEYFTRVAVQMEKSVGQSVKQTAQDLADLGKSPLEASEKLNEKYRYLTAAVYEQIKALQEQGRIEEAAAAAQNAYASAFDTRSKQINENLGTIERGWAAITGVAKSAWDAMLGVGRKRTLSEQLSDITSEITKGQKPFDPSVGGNAEARAKLSANLQLQASIQELIRLERRQGEVTAENLRTDEARIAWMKEGDKYLSKAAQMEREIAKAREQGRSAGASLAEIEDRIGKIREKYKESAGAVSTDVANMRARLKAEQEYLQQLKLHGSAAEKLNDGEKDAIKFAELLKGKLDAKTRARTEELLVIAKQRAATLNSTEALQEEIKATDDAAKSRIKFNLSLADGLKKIEDDIKAQELHNARLGLSKDAIGELEAAKLDDQATTLEGLAIKSMDKNLDSAQYDLYKAQAEKLRELADLKRQGGIKETMIEESKKAFDSWKRDYDRIGDWLGDALQRGFESGKGFLRSFTDSIKSALLRLGTQWITAPFAAAGASLMNPTAAQAGTAGGIGQGMNLFSAGKALWEGFNNGFANFGSSIAQTVQSGMNLFGSAPVARFSDAAFSAGMPGAATSNISPFAQGVGNLAPYLASIGIGKMVSSAISNGYQINHGNALNNIGALGGIIGSTITGAINRAFGTKVVGAGLMGSVTGDQFTGNGYQFSRGGFLRGGGRTSTSDLDGATTKAFASAISTVYESFSSLGEAIGAGGNLLEDYNYSFRLALGDFSDEDKPRIIQNQLKRMTDSMAAAFVDNFRTSIDAASQQANAYYTNTIDGESGRPTGASGIITQTRAASQLEPYIDDIIRIFDTKRAELGGNEETLGQLATFTTALFGLGDALVENAGYARLFGEAIDFDKLETAANEGETVLDTFARLNTVFSATNSVALTLGKDISTAFGAIGVASTDARQRLIDLVGGVDALTAGTAFFAQNFLTEAEQMAPVISSVAETMAELGYSSVDTKEEFADLVKGLNLGTEAGAGLYAKLIAIAPAFNQVATYAESLSETLRGLQGETANLQVELLRAQGNDTGADAAQRSIDIAGMTAAEVAVYDYNASIRAQVAALNEASAAASRVAEERLGLETQLLQLQGNTAELRRRELEALDPANRALQQRIYGLQDAAKAYESSLRTVDAAFSAVQRAVDAERKSITASYTSSVDAVNKRIKDVTGSVGKLSSLSNALRSTLDRMRLPEGGVPDRAAAQAQIQTAIAIARAGGPLPTAESLSKSLQVLSEPNEKLFVTFDDYKREVATQSNLIGELADLTDGQISIDESTLSVLTEQLNTEKAWYDGEMTRLDGILAAAQESINTLKGIPTGIMSIADAVASLRGAVNVAASAQASVATLNNTQSDIINGLYQNILGRDPRAEGAQFWQQALVTNPKYRTGESSIFADFIEGAVNAGGTDAERARAWARENNIQGFAVGTNYVPHDMPALIHEGERIVPAADNRALLAALRNPSQGTAEMVAEIRALRAEVAQLRQSNSDENAAIALHTLNTADTLEKFDVIGMPDVRPA